jgi:hypothetical protein
MWPSANSAGTTVSRSKKPLEGRQKVFSQRYAAPDGAPLDELRIYPRLFAVGQTMSALTGLAREEYVTVFTDSSTKAPCPRTQNTGTTYLNCRGRNLQAIENVSMEGASKTAVEWAGRIHRVFNSHRGRARKTTDLG